MKSSREQFEEWVVSKSRGSLNLSFEMLCNGDYRSTLLQKRWQSWQASRAAMAREEVTTAPFLKVD